MPPCRAPSWLAPHRCVSPAGGGKMDWPCWRCSGLREASPPGPPGVPAGGWQRALLLLSGLIASGTDPGIEQPQVPLEIGGSQRRKWRRGLRKVRGLRAHVGFLKIKDVSFRASFLYFTFLPSLHPFFPLFLLQGYYVHSLEREREEKRNINCLPYAPNRMEPAT